MSVWASVDALGSTDYFISQVKSTGSNQGWSLFKNPSGGSYENKPIIRIQGNSTGYIEIAYSPALAANTLYHFTFTYDGTGVASGVKLYINGSLATVDTAIDTLAAAPTLPDENIYLGGRSSGTSGRHVGYLSNAQLYNRVLTPTEVSALYSAGPLTSTWVAPSNFVDGTFLFKSAGGSNGLFDAQYTDGSSRFRVTGSTGIVEFNANGGQTFVGGSPDLGARLNVSALTSGTIPVAIIGTTSQTADLLRINSDTHTDGDMLKVTAAGKMVIGGPTVQIKTILTVSTLPTCNSGAEGTFAAVNDAATTPVYNATVASGGSVHISVYCNGTNWVNH